VSTNPSQPLGVANAKAKRKQQLLLAGVIAVVAAIAIAGGTLMGSPPKKVATANAKEPTRIPIFTPGEGLNDKDSWRAQEAAKISENNRTLTELTAKLSALEKRESERKLEDSKPKPVETKGVVSNTPLNPPINTAPAPTPAQPAANPNGRGGYAMGVGIGQQIVNAPQTPAGAQQRGPVGYPPGTPAGVPQGANGVAPNAQGGFPNGAAPMMQGTRIQRISSSASSESGADTAAGAAKPTAKAADLRGDSATGASRGNPAQIRTAENYLPSGTFIEGRLLSGIDAPTGGQAQNNPMPLLIQLTSHAFLPSSMRSEVKGCFVIGTAFGDISSERANGRTESLSCIKEDGTAIDIPIKGYIAGEDGKAGLRGRLVSKQGQILANALTAGLISGIGQALSFSSTTQTTSALGNVVSTPNPGDEAKAGFGTGFGKAMDKLAAYYITLADKVFPIIEVDADRKVTIVLTKGTFIDNQREAPSISDSLRSGTGGLVDAVARSSRDAVQQVRDAAR
jgi:conjugal transfer pilus assembly protein TraB